MSESKVIMLIMFAGTLNDHLCYRTEVGLGLTDCRIEGSRFSFFCTLLRGGRVADVLF